MRKNIVIFLLSSLLIFASCLAYIFYTTDYEVPLKNYSNKKILNKLFSIDNEPFKNLISLNLIISEDVKKNLTKTRNLFLKYGYIGNDLPNPYHPIKIKIKDSTYEAKIRFKGDFLDHISDKIKWSYKIKLKGSTKIMGMKEFSIQRPEVRNGFGELLFHEILKKFEFPTIKYDFINVYENDIHFGLYAIEGRFNFGFFESNKIKVSPIIKYNDQEFFNHKRRISGKAKNGVIWSDWSYFSSQIDCYKLDKIIKDASLKKVLEEQTKNLELLRQGEIKCSEVFDIKKLATFYAICDLFGSYHATQFPNLRYYFDYNLEKLVPIGYDANGLSKIDLLFGQELSKYGSENYGGKRFEHRLNFLLLDEDFLSEYHKQLNKFSSLDYCDSILKQTNLDNGFYDNVMKELNFSIDQIYNNCNVISSNINTSNRIYANLIFANEDKIEISIINRNFISSEVIDIVNSKNEIIASKPKPNIIWFREKASHSKFQRPIFFVNQSYNINDLFLRFKVLGLEKIDKVKILGWKITE